MIPKAIVTIAVAITLALPLGGLLASPAQAAGGSDEVCLRNSTDLRCVDVKNSVNQAGQALWLYGGGNDDLWVVVDIGLVNDSTFKDSSLNQRYSGNIISVFKDSQDTTLCMAELSGTVELRKCTDSGVQWVDASSGREISIAYTNASNNGDPYALTAAGTADKSLLYLSPPDSTLWQVWAVAPPGL